MQVYKKKKPPGVVLSNIYYFVGVIPGTERSYSRDLELIFYMGANNFHIRVYSFRVIERRASFSHLLMECIWFFFLFVDYMAKGGLLILFILMN